MEKKFAILNEEDDDINRVNQAKALNSEIKTIDIALDIGVSICKIIIPSKNALGTGFLIKLKRKNNPFYCLMTNEHVITKESVLKKEIITILYNNQHDVINIELNRDERYIQDFVYLGIDITIVEILLDIDKIRKNYFLLPDMDYLNGYEQFKDKKIYIFQFPEGGSLSYSVGTIKEVDIFKYDMTHLASTLSGSSGSPIILYGSNLVLGIHKQGNKVLNENYGNFIGPVIDILQKDIKIEKLFLDNYVYEGELKNNIIKEGKGKLTYNNGVIYIGEFKNDKYNGKGVLYIKKNKLVYEGYFLNGLFEGKGKFYQQNGDCYIGNFKNGKPDGIGKEYFQKTDILKYKGGFKNDCYHGEGEFYDQKGRLLCKGKFEYDKLVYGILYYDNGDYYEGEIKDFAANGKGAEYYKNGKPKRIGNFVNGVIEGEGKFFNEDGSYYCGQFKHGKRYQKGKEYDKNGVFLYEWYFPNNQNNVIIQGNPEQKKDETKSDENKKEIKGEENKNNNNEIFNNYTTKGNEISEENKNTDKGDDLIIFDLNKKIIENGEYINMKGKIEIKKSDFHNNNIRGNFKIEGDNGNTISGYGKYKDELFVGEMKVLDKNNKLIYEGEFVDYTLEGYGKQIYPNEFYYIGYFKNGEKNGEGILFDKYDNIIYEGEFKNNKMNGKGILYNNNEIKYEGNFVDNEFDGNGKLIKENGSYYIGEFKKGLENGKGQKFRKNGSLMEEGYYIEGYLEGKGKKIFDNNDYYIGEFKKGLFHGKGELFNVNNNLIEKGNYENDCLEGQGKRILDGNKYYEGQFKKGLYNGNGKICDANDKLVYEGDFINGKYDGNGKLFYDNGNLYIGGFKDGKEKGEGILFDRNYNVLYEGNFDKDKGIGFE